MRNIIRKAIVGTTVAVGTATLLPFAAMASSHREAPAVSRTPMVDSTDFYMFMSYDPARADYVTVIANYLPLQDSYGGPNYFSLDQDAIYELHIDSDGDAREDLTFQFDFDNDLALNGRGLAVPVGPKGKEQDIPVPLKNIGPVGGANGNAALNVRESFELDIIRGDRRDESRNKVRTFHAVGVNGNTKFGKPYDFVGTKTFGSVAGYEAYAKSFIHSFTFDGCGYPANVFVGQRKESFVVNLGEVFDLINIIPLEVGFLPGGLGIAQDVRNDDIRFKNITTLAVEVHKSCLVGNGNGNIGGWTSASLRQGRVLNPFATFETPDISGGPWTQVSRLGMPLFNEVIVGLPDKDRYSATEPKNDSQFSTYVSRPSLPTIISLLFKDTINNVLGAQIDNLAPNNYPRADLQATFLTGFPGVNSLKKVTPSEMLRLNTGIPVTPKDQQSSFGVAGLDFAGFPNGRRPGDDVVDIE
ncbi:MAG TPA: DUF4331 domain-containing protein, partial [Steroidobacteraceae bacterium]|nr:DUF4331 domain-containing protein [Steroidobacteraceae bacterium]